MRDARWFTPEQVSPIPESQRLQPAAIMQSIARRLIEDWLSAQD